MEIISKRQSVNKRFVALIHFIVRNFLPIAYCFSKDDIPRRHVYGMILAGNSLRIDNHLAYPVKKSNDLDMASVTGLSYGNVVA